MSALVSKIETCPKCSVDFCCSPKYTRDLCVQCRLEESMLGQLSPGDRVLDVGSGMARYHRALRAHVQRPLTLLDAHAPYMQEHKPPADDIQIVGDLRAVLPRLRDRTFDAVLIIDVLEHLEHEQVPNVVDELKRISSGVVLAFTPDGFIAQSHDRHGLGAEHWQTHRCGLTASDFSKMGFRFVERWTDFHLATDPAGPRAALWAGWARAEDGQGCDLSDDGQ